MRKNTTTHHRERIKGIALVLLLLASLIMALLAGCSDEEDFNYPVEPAYLDANELLTSYAADLKSAPNGWEGLLVRSQGKMYRMHIKFSDANVTMLADVDTVSAISPSESGYQLTVSNGQPSISFPAGSHLDRMQNPEDNDGVDKEYTLKGKTENEIFLQGNTLGDQLVLRRASADVEYNFYEGEVKRSIKGITSYLANVRLLYFEPEAGKKIQFVIRPNLRSTYFTYVDNEKAEFFGSDYTYTFDGIELKSDATLLGVDIGSLSFDENLKKFFVVYNGSPLYATETQVPVIPLHYLLGNEFSSGILLTAEWYQQQPGWSYKFREQWTLTDFDLDESEFGLGMLFVYLNLNPDTERMTLKIYTIDLYGRAHIAAFPYKYTKTDGIFDFESLPIDESTTAGQYAAEFETELSRMRNIINNYTFSIDFYDYLGQLMPQYQSQEDNEMYFTGSFY